MNFKKTWKRANDGFTLVELIVVIAILAILAGIAVPAYSGYIKKANKAADLQLLSAVNTAFAAAVLENGEDFNAVTNATLVRSSNGEGMTISGVTGVQGVKNVDYNTSFLNYLSASSVQTKVLTDARFVPGVGFVDPSSDTANFKSYSYNGTTLYIGQSTINSLLGSSYYGENMTSEKLLNQVNTVAAIAGGIGSVQNIMGTEGFVNSALTAFGVTPGADAAANKTLMEEKASELALKKMGLTNMSQLTADNQAEYQQNLQNISNNALILYTAQNATQLNTESAKGLLTNINTQNIVDAMASTNAADNEKGMTQAALAYGMYYAYVNSDSCTDSSLKNGNIGTLEVTTALDSNQEFKSYITSAQGEKDMEAYLQALNVINSSAQQPEAVEHVITQGFNNSELISILQQSMGK